MCITLSCNNDKQPNKNMPNKKRKLSRYTRRVDTDLLTILTILAVSVAVSSFLALGAINIYLGAG